MHYGILPAAIENRAHWPCPSRSFWIFQLRILANSACPHENSSQIWNGITKFAPNMHPDIISVGIGNGGHWPWPYGHFGHFDSELSEIWLAHAITCNGIELDPLNLPQMCILRLSELVLKIGLIDIDLQGHLSKSTQNAKKRRSTSLAYADLAGQWVLHATNVLLLYLPMRCFCTGICCIGLTFQHIVWPPYLDLCLMLKPSDRYVCDCINALYIKGTCRSNMQWSEN